MLSWLSALSCSDVLLVASALALAVWALGTRAHSHFRRRALPACPRPWPFVGSVGRAALGLQAFPDLQRELYDRGAGHALFGFWQFNRPMLMVRHPEHIKRVAIKDFDHFTDHHPLFSEKLNPLIARNLVSLKGQEWREMRNTLSPAFTSSKMRAMFELIDACGAQVLGHVAERTSGSPEGLLEVDARDLFSRFATDVIASTAFGLRVDSLREPKNAFHAAGHDLTDVSGLRVILVFGFLLCPALMDALHLSFVPNKVLKYFRDVVMSTIKERKEKGITRPDMLQLLMQAREGKLKAEEGDEHEVDGAKAGNRRLTDEDITSQAAIFFFAGFDTVTRLMCYTAMRLTLHPDVQQRLQREVDEQLEAHGGKVSYEALKGMKYLDAVICEVQRLHSGDILDRICVKDYTFPALDGSPAYTVLKGEYIIIPQHGLHLDPQHWPQPHKFDPERFSEENRAGIKPFTFMPFGLGPRACIGERFALMETKAVLALLLSRFSFRPTAKTPKEIRYKRFDAGDGIAGGYAIGLASRT